MTLNREVKIYSEVQNIEKQIFSSNEEQLKIRLYISEYI